MNAVHHATLATAVNRLALLRSTMSSKRKWDQAGPEGETGDETPTKAQKAEDGKTASEAAAAAAALAAKIAAQYAAGGIPSGSGLKDPHDAEFTYDIDINDVRNRYILTKGTTQQEVRGVERTSRRFVDQVWKIHDETGASVSTKGTWYPDRSKATDKDPPLYLHISATTKDILQKGIDKVNELLAQDLGPLIDDRRGRDRERVSFLSRPMLCFHLMFRSEEMAGGESTCRHRVPSELQRPCQGRWSSGGSHTSLCTTFF
jgi:hypothetical protein